MWSGRNMLLCSNSQNNFENFNRFYRIENYWFFRVIAELNRKMKYGKCQNRCHPWISFKLGDELTIKYRRAEGKVTAMSNWQKTPKNQFLRVELQWGMASLKLSNNRNFLSNSSILKTHISRLVILKMNLFARFCWSSEVDSKFMFKILETWSSTSHDECEGWKVLYENQKNYLFIMEWIFRWLL